MTHTFKTTALDKAFNCAVLTMANITAPGWSSTPDDNEAPSTWEQIQARARQGKPFLVWEGGSDNTIFGEPSFNWAFRAWHDSAHLRANADLSHAGEIAACEQQCKDLIARYGDSEQTRKWCQMIRIEVIGQAEVYNETGEFISDQVQFMLDSLAKGAFA